MRVLICLLLVLLTQIRSPEEAKANTMELLKLPMTLTVVRGTGKNCEPICPQWIAAEGRITPKTPAMLRKVLKGLGKTKLPILLDSLGGDLDAAIEMGMLIRDEGLSVAIASTGYINCDPRTLYCFEGKKPKGPYKGFAVYSGYCVSTCIFVLAGGKKRLAGGAMSVASDHPSTFSSKKSQEQIQEDIEGILARTIGGFMVLDLMNKASADSPYRFTPEDLLKTYLVTSGDWGDSLVDPTLCKQPDPPSNCVKRNN